MRRYEERRSQLQNIFQDTMRCIENDDQLAEETAAMVAGTKVYLDEIAIDAGRVKGKNAKIRVVEDTSFHCAGKLVGQGKVAVLNFANAVNPGGGVLRGASAQEESLCRSSNLYAGLTSPQMMEQYYERNRACFNKFGSDSLGYHPGVTVFKNDDARPNMMDKQDWFRVDVITCAAPRMEPASSISNAELYEIHVRRGKRIIRAAMENQADILILGAFGCGAFHNDPEIVAKAYRYLLVEEGYAEFFRQIVFAIKKDHNDEKGNYDYFRKILSPSLPLTTCSCTLPKVNHN